MKPWNLMMAALLLSVVVTACNTQPGTTTDADNTSRNEGDQRPEALTAEDQGNTDTDREISANIRKLIVDDDSLSVNAHNIKIITSDQVVTLEGPVKSPREKEIIEAKAKEVAGNRRIDNRLEVEVSP